MPRYVVRIDLPPEGELETSGDGSSPTDEQMAQEQQARQRFVDVVSPYFASLPDRPPRRAGNVSRVELLGANVWSELNHYLAVLHVDIGGFDVSELSELLPQGSTVSVIGDYGPLAEWPAAPGDSA